MSATEAKEHSRPARIFGIFLVIVSVVVLVVAVSQWVMDTNRIRENALIKRTTKIAPLKPGWQVELPANIKDPRSIQTWIRRDAESSLAAQDAQSGWTGPMLAQNQSMMLIKGTDGKVSTQALALINNDSGAVVWMKPYDDLPLDYCHNQLWQSSIVCESKAAKTIVRIDPQGNITAAGLPGGMWDAATGDHVIGGVLDKFLVVPIGIAQGSSAGVEAEFVDPSFNTHAKYQMLVPNAAATQPLHMHTRGAITLMGAVTSAADGSNRQHTWGYSYNMNFSRGSLDTSMLGDASQVSLLEAGFFGSADYSESAPDQVDWVLYKADGGIQSQGKAPRIVVQAMHTQLREGLFLDLTAAARVMQSQKVPAIMPDRSYLLGSIEPTCGDWPGCASKHWVTSDGAKMTLTRPGVPIFSDSTRTVFDQGNGTVSAYGLADGKPLWEGMVPSHKDGSDRGKVLGVGAGLAQLNQKGSMEKGDAKSFLTYWALP